MTKKIDNSAIITLIKNFDYEMLSDQEWNEYREVDPLNEKKMLYLLDRVIVPEYESMNRRSKEIIKSSLAGILSLPDFDYGQILSAVEMPFEPIEKPERFFALIWLALFGVVSENGKNSTLS